MIRIVERIYGIALALALLRLAAEGGAAELAWPARVASTNTALGIVSGAAPADLGRFGQCRVHALGPSDAGGERFLLVTEYDHDRAPQGPVRLEHAGGVCAVFMRRHNGSTAEFRPAEVSMPRGLFIYLTGIIGLTPPEANLVRTFHAAGWHVLVSETSFNFLQRRSVPIDPAKIDAATTALGRDVDDHLADKAYAVESMLTVIARRHPGLRLHPRVLAGGSAGSIAVPAVAARIGRPDATVLIGAGGNIGRILCGSSLEPVSLFQLESENGQVYRRQLAPDVLRRVADAIHARSSLDPLRLAPVLRGRPVFMMRGELDRMMPAETNDLLWEALGRPQRWSLPVNHLVLFGLLQFQSGAILDWVDGALAGTAAEP